MLVLQIVALLDAPERLDELHLIRGALEATRHLDEDVSVDLHLGECLNRIKAVELEVDARGDRDEGAEAGGSKCGCEDLGLLGALAHVVAARDDPSLD